MWDTTKLIGPLTVMQDSEVMGGPGQVRRMWDTRRSPEMHQLLDKEDPFRSPLELASVAQALSDPCKRDPQQRQPPHPAYCAMPTNQPDGPRALAAVMPRHAGPER